MGVGSSSLTGLNVPISGSDNSDWRVEEQLLRMPVSSLQTLISKHTQLLKTMARVLQVRGEKLPPELAVLVVPPSATRPPMSPSLPAFGMGSMGSMGGVPMGMGYDPAMGSSMYGYPGPMGGAPKNKRSKKSPKTLSKATPKKK